MARRFATVRRGGREVRETRWLDAVPIRTTTATGAAVILFSLTAVELALRPFTIVRTRGVFHIKSDQVAATEPQQAGIGMCVVTEQALAIGVTAVPTPITDMESDLWFLYELAFSEFVFGSAIGFDAAAGSQVRFDSKAMRKVEDGQDVIVVVEVPRSASSEAVTHQVGFRMLIKLH